jgi:hypothetical protein
MDRAYKDKNFGQQQTTTKSSSLIDEELVDYYCMELKTVSDLHLLKRQSCISTKALSFYENIVH